MALSVDGTVTKGERNEVVNRPGEVAVMVHGPQDQSEFHIYVTCLCNEFSTVEWCYV